MSTNDLTDLLLLLLVVVVVVDDVVVAAVVAMSLDNEVDEDEADLSLLLPPFTGPHRSSGQISSGMSSPAAFLAAFTSSSGVIAIDWKRQKRHDYNLPLTHSLTLQTCVYIGDYSETWILWTPWDQP